LIGDRCSVGDTRDFEVIAAPPQIDDVVVVRVLENARKIPVAQTFTVAAEQLTRLRAYGAGSHCSVALHEVGHRATEQIEGLVACEAFASCTDRLSRLRSRAALGTIRTMRPLSSAATRRR
jgi:hypothetical protein